MLDQSVPADHEYPVHGTGDQVYFYDDYDYTISDTDSKDDDGFESYVETTVNPGPWGLVLTTLVSFFLMAMIPLFVVMGEKWKSCRKRRRQLRQEGILLSEDDDDDEDASQRTIPKNDNDYSRQSTVSDQLPKRKARNEEKEIVFATNPLLGINCFGSIGSSSSVSNYNGDDDHNRQQLETLSASAVQTSLLDLFTGGTHTLSTTQSPHLAGMHSTNELPGVKANINIDARVGALLKHSDDEDLHVASSQNATEPSSLILAEGNSVNGKSCGDDLVETKTESIVQRHDLLGVGIYQGAAQDNAAISRFEKFGGGAEGDKGMAKETARSNDKTPFCGGASSSPAKLMVRCDSQMSDNCHPKNLDNAESEIQNGSTVTTPESSNLPLDNDNVASILDGSNQHNLPCVSVPSNHEKASFDNHSASSSSYVDLFCAESAKNGDERDLIHDANGARLVELGGYLPHALTAGATNQSRGHQNPNPMNGLREGEQSADDDTHDGSSVSSLKAPSIASLKAPSVASSKAGSSVASSKVGSVASSVAASVYSFTGLASLQVVVDEYVSSGEIWHPKGKDQRRLKGAAQVVDVILHGKGAELVDEAAELDSLNDEVNAGNKMRMTQGGSDVLKARSSRHHPSNLVLVTGLQQYKFYRCDGDMKGILKLALPFTIHTFVMHVFSLMELAVVGRLVGTADLSALFVVDLVFSLSTMFIAGAVASLFTLCSHAVGGKRYYLAGQYVQIAVIFYQVLFIPFIVIWWFLLDDVVLLFGFDQQVAEIAVSYAQILYITYLFKVYGEGLNYILEVTGYEVHTAVFAIVKQGAIFAAIFFMAKYGEPSLREIALIRLGMEILFMVAFVALILRGRWLEKEYWSGMVGNFAFSNREAVRIFLRTSLPLALGYIMSTGEWEVLTVFAGFMGPAEVSAWGLVGWLWEAIEEISLALADAAEVQVAKMVGSGQPYRARGIANKSLYLGTIISLVFSIPIIGMRNVLPRCFTTDETLQRMLSELLPYIGIGNIALMFGSMCWTILGAQGRYALATAVGFLGSWFVTLPLSTITTFVFDLDLQSMAGAVVVGYAFSGALNASLVMRSNWDKISARVIKDTNKGAGYEDVTPPLSGSAALADVDYDDFGWDELPDYAQSAAALLGYSKCIWDKGLEPFTSDYTWDELDPEQREAATTLGYNEEKWNDDDR
ncbi:hypothetical protein ACA910_004079 [Epithemia clementina (nom. ined.)]